MAELVGAFATSHVLFGSPDEDAQALRVVDGMNEIGRRVRELKPDLLVVIGSDHLFNITTKLQPPFTVGVSDTFTPFGDMDIERRPFAGHQTFAKALCRRAADSFDLAQAEELRPDHGIMIPLMFVDPDGTTPVVPILVNANMDPAPSPRRCAALGEVIAKTIAEDLAVDLRVVAIATGGLSHWINVPNHGEVNQAFDAEVIDALVSGNLNGLTRMSVAELFEKAGNGGLEIANWLMVATMAESRGWRGERIYYEPMPQWMTGMGGVAFR